MPLHADNAAVKAGAILGRIAAYRPPARIHDLWQRFVDGLGLSAAQRFALTHTTTLDTAIGRLPRGVERMFSASTRTTFSPNVVSSGVKINVIPDSATIDIDVRTLPGDDGEPVLRMLAEAIGDLWADCEVVFQKSNPATTSPIGTPLWDVLTEVTGKLVPDATTVPMILMGATDARFFRRKGVVAYGYGLLSERIPFDQFAQMFHGNDERVDQESLRLSAELFEQVAREFIGPA
jgi:acetylornithine deacetylase/succinyl-diaminopimelate desuccinylase-like protein